MKMKHQHLPHSAPSQLARDAGGPARAAWPILVLALGLVCPPRGARAALVGWNNLGMHCMDRDFSVFSILPPSRLS